MTIKEIRSMSAAELEKQLATQKEQLQSLRFKVRENQLKSVRQVRALRKTIARLETVRTAISARV